ACILLIQFEILIFFFQAEDGIRDRNVTGVQTCALPISLSTSVVRSVLICAHCIEITSLHKHIFHFLCTPMGVLEMWERWNQDKRSEERRVGKEWRERSARPE